MKTTLFATACVILTGVISFPSPSVAQQKAAKQCRDERPAKKAGSQGKGIKEKDYVEHCRAGRLTAARATLGVSGRQQAMLDANTVSNFIAAWQARAEQVRANQPAWSSPLITTTGMLEQRFRFDAAEQHAGNGANTTMLDGGRGLDLIVSNSNEVQIAAPPYDIRTTPTGKGNLSGFNDWAFLRVKQQLASSPASGGDYFVTVWLQIQAPTGTAPLTNDAWTYLPTLAFGKGWGDFDIQATVGGVLPASHVATLGDQIQTNVAFQYHLMKVFWPEFEVNWTYYADGQRGGLNQVYLTPGLVVGRFQIADGVLFTTGVGYQIAVAPNYRPSPLTPAYSNALVVTSRFNF